MSVDRLPAIGFGTYTAKGNTCAEAVETALEIGYRHVDTAEMYENQASVGTGLANASVDRDDVTLATKLDSHHLSYDDVLSHAEQCRDTLGVDQIDLLYIHWPIRTYDPEHTLPALDELRDRGVIRHIGVSNFTPSLLHEAIDILDAPIVAHQVECHPLLPQRELRSLAVAHDHALVAYCPLVRGEVGEIPTIREIAEARDATPAQVSLAWLMAQDQVVPIPKSATPSHIEENFRATTLELSEEDLDRIDTIDRTKRLVDFPVAPWND